MQNVLYSPIGDLSRWLHELSSSLKGREPAEAILDLLSQKCALRIIAEIKAGEIRFNALARRIDASANTIRARLNELAEAGIIERTVISQMPPSVSFRLTRKGEELAEVVARLLEWEVRWSTADRIGRAAVSLAAEEVKPYRPE